MPSASPSRPDQLGEPLRSCRRSRSRGRGRGHRGAAGAPPSPPRHGRRARRSTRSRNLDEATRTAGRSRPRPPRRLRPTVIDAARAALMRAGPSRSPPWSKPAACSASRDPRTGASSHPVLAQLEQPGHLVVAGVRAVLLPAPDAPDQATAEPPPARSRPRAAPRPRSSAAPPRAAASPRAAPPPALAQAPHRVQLDLRVEDLDERIQIPLVEGAG